MLKIVKTSDGSNTIFNSEVGENYHSHHGALQESKHVFVKSGLQYFLDKTETKQISILEVGFGTGLNFLLSADYCTAENIQLDYTGIEAYPLTDEMISQTGKLMDFQSDQKFDVIYFDAFAATYQPEMWDEAAITHTLQFLKPGGVFVTYAITGNLKRIVKSLGLKIEKAPGAPGKREMLRAY